MKKLIAVVALVAATAGMISCGNSTPKASLKTDIDTLSYSIGLAQTNGLKDYLRWMWRIDLAKVYGLFLRYQIK